MDDMHFSDLALSPEILRAVEDMGYVTATEIQAKSIPLLLEGKDVIGRSNTGTGKTAAFGIPAIESIDQDMRRITQVLILCPTRELAMQASNEISKFAKYKPYVRPVAIYGGAPIERQIAQLRVGANIVIGTPGRVMDHMRRNTLDLSQLRMVILDEADEMLNMGFREDIETILADVPEERQTVLFSATMPPEILAITRQYQREPELVKVQNKQRTVETIEQRYYEAPFGRKTDVLQLLLMMYEPKLSMIFCNTKKMVDELVEDLAHRGFKAAGLHGDMKQSARTLVMDRFKSGRTPILIATDVAARGIDVDDVDAVFNYDLPQDHEYYIHRIGRTGRAGKSGKAYTLTSGRRQVYEIRELERFVKAPIVLSAVPRAEEIAEMRLQKFCERVLAMVESGKHEEYLPVVEKLTMGEGAPSFSEIAAALVAITYGKERRVIPDMRISAPGSAPYRPGERRTEGAPRRISPGMANVVLTAGKEHNVAANHILGSLVEATGMSGRDVGKIRILDQYSLVEVPEADKDRVVSVMSGAKINGRKISARLADTGDYPTGASGAPSGRGRGRSQGQFPRRDSGSRPRRSADRYRD